MWITKFSHACVRVEDAGRVLVIDPGVWSEPDALNGADAVLVTHEHADHIDVRRLADLGAPVYAPAGADVGPLDVHRVRSGETFTAAAFTVRALGGRHAVTHGDQPDCANLSYLVNGLLYHPGDSLHVPAEPVETLLVPVQAPWLKLTEAIDFVRAIRPERAYGIHDAMINERGLASANRWLTEETAVYRWLAPRETPEDGR
jgi:L-ascorbate metabolism protein UlaG (beta-lactamase superfamily)